MGKDSAWWMSRETLCRAGMRAELVLLVLEHAQEFEGLVTADQPLQRLGFLCEDTSIFFFPSPQHDSKTFLARKTPFLLMHRAVHHAACALSSGKNIRDHKSR